MDRKPREGSGLFREVCEILLVGIALGVLYNQASGGGLTGPPQLSWIATDRLSEMASLEQLSGPSAAADGLSAPGGVGDDPMAIPAGGQGAAGLPQIPELDRPIEIQLSAVQQLSAAGGAVFVDARDADEYAAGHIPGALSMPYDVVSSEPERLENLETGGRPIVVYCGGGSCELSLNLAWDLIYAGQKKVTVYMGGYPEWESSGSPVERGNG